MTTEQINHETTKIRRGALSYEQYLRLSRVGETFKMSRADKRMVYQTHLDQFQAIQDKREAQLKNRLSPEGEASYNAITKHRDEVMLISA